MSLNRLASPHFFFPARETSKLLGIGTALSLTLATTSLASAQSSARGAWLTTELLPAGGAASDAEQAIARRLREQATRVGAALTREGYFGPFGIDAYTYRDELSDVHFQAASEINARYSMGFAVGWNAERGGAPVRVG